MAGDREKTAGQAAKEKVERREGIDQPEQEASSDRAGESDQRSAQEREQDLAPGTIEPEGIKPGEDDRAKSSDELREDVEAAREQLAETVEQLGEKLDPRPNIDAAREKAKGQASAVGEGARANAIPIAVGATLIIALLIWLRRR